MSSNANDSNADDPNVQSPGRAGEPTRLLLARHGQSTWNAEGRWQGQADPPLSDLGRDQAFSAAQRIGTVDLVVASPQDRARTTAQIISDSIGVGPVITLDGLMERDAGPWSGLTTREIEATWPGWLDEGKRPEEYEDDDSLFERANAALSAVVISHPGGTALVVCHGGVIHTVEAKLGISAGRVPNLSGRVLTGRANPNGENGDGGAAVEWEVGETLQLLDDGEITGGQHQHRV